MPRLPPKATFAVTVRMSALGQKRTFAPQKAMSRFTPESGHWAQRIRVGNTGTIASPSTHTAHHQHTTPFSMFGATVFFPSTRAPSHGINHLLTGPAHVAEPSIATIGNAPCIPSQGQPQGRRKQVQSPPHRCGATIRTARPPGLDDGSKASGQNWPNSRSPI